MTVAPTWSSAIGTLRMPCARGRRTQPKNRIVTILRLREMPSTRIVAAIRAIPDHERFSPRFRSRTSRGLPGTTLLCIFPPPTRVV